MFLDRVDFLVGEGEGFALVARRAHAGKRPEGAVALVAPGASGDLRHFRGGEPPLAPPVKLGERRESHVIEIEVQSHPDRIGGDDVIDLARLEQRDLLIAGLGRKRPHHHRRAAAEPSQRLGHGVDLLDREGDHGRALGQARQLAHPGMAERGKARAGGDLGLGDQRPDHRLQGGRAEDHRLLAAACVEQPVGEDVAALRVCAQLRLVNRDEGVFAHRARHGLGGTEEIARLGRFDPFLAGDQRDLLVALYRAHPVIDLARQQAQREAHHAAGVPAHPLDRQVRLAGIGRPEHRAHAFIAIVSGAGMRGDGHNGGVVAGLPTRSKAAAGGLWRIRVTSYRTRDTIDRWLTPDLL